MEKILSAVLKHNHYDSVNNFILFFDKYIKSGEPLEAFYLKYNAPIRSKQHTCVGLSLCLMTRMKQLYGKFEGLRDATSLLSCEEAVKVDVKDYIKKSRGPHHLPSLSAEKEHVLVGVQILLGERVGVMIADPGCHVSKVVTIMDDGRSPHTGPFMQYYRDNKFKENNYCVSQVNKSYVEWHELQTKNGIQTRLISLIFKSRPYLSAVEVTEKRNVIFNLKSHLKRDSKGNLIAGYYFSLNTNFEAATVTVLLGLEPKIKLMFKDFSDPHNIPKESADKIRDISSFMNYSERHVMGIMCKLSKIMAKKSFIDETMRLNEEVIQSLKYYEK